MRRTPEFEQLVGMTRSDAYRRLVNALDSTHGDAKYEATITQAENAFVAGEYVRMCELLDSLDARRTLTIDYTNWKGVRGERKVIPVKIWFGSTEFHPAEQWLLDALDIAKNEMRTFALVDIHSMMK